MRCMKVDYVEGQQLQYTFKLPIDINLIKITHIIPREMFKQAPFTNVNNAG